MVIVGMTTVPITKWYLSLNDSTIKTEERMQAQSYAFNEWQLVLAEDYDDLSSKDRKNVSDKFDLKRDVGAEKTISGSGKEKDVVITVYRKGTNQVAYAMQSGKARPALDKYYTKEQIDNLVEKVNKRLDGKEFVKNKTPDYDLNFRYEKLDSDTELTLHAYNGDTQLEFGGRNSYGALDYNEVLLITWKDNRASIPEQDVSVASTNGIFIAPCDGVLYFNKSIIARGTYYGRPYNPRDVESVANSGGYYWINDRVGFDSAGYNFHLAKGDVFRWRNDDWWWMFIPYKGQGFTRAKYLSGAYGSYNLK